MKHIITIWKIPRVLNLMRILILKIYMHIRLHSICETDIVRSISVLTDNIHPIGVVKPVYGYTTFPFTTKAVYQKDTQLKNGYDQISRYLCRLTYLLSVEGSRWVPCCILWSVYSSPRSWFPYSNRILPLFLIP